MPSFFAVRLEHHEGGEVTVGPLSQFAQWRAAEVDGQVRYRSHMIYIYIYIYQGAFCHSLLQRGHPLITFHNPFSQWATHALSDDGSARTAGRGFARIL